VDTAVVVVAVDAGALEVVVATVVAVGTVVDAEPASLSEQAGRARARKIKVTGRRRTTVSW
jgi:hypothetical protein